MRPECESVLSLREEKRSGDRVLGNTNMKEGQKMKTSSRWLKQAIAVEIGRLGEKRAMEAQGGNLKGNLLNSAQGCKEFLS